MAKILFKDGKVQFDDTGKILFTQAGDDPADCACCGGSCTASGTSCTHCTDVTPSQYEVTFDGVKLCECAYFVSTVDYGQPLWNTNVNTGHTLSQSTCLWRLTVANGIAVEVYGSDNTCTTSTGTPVSDYIITLTRDSLTSFILSVYREASIDSLIFYSRVTGLTTGVCATLPVFNNQFTISDCDTNSTLLGRTTDVIAYGGSATVVCL